ncbi:MAG: hypothetical protein LBJ31_10115 [Treponema sp.]|jgi:integrase|nr:hypothetical protein [Treponema sp.]
MNYRKTGVNDNSIFCSTECSKGIYMPHALGGVEIMRRFNFYRRNGIYYARLITPQGIQLSGRSTKTQNRDDALLVVAEWLKSGVPMGRDRKPKPVELAADLPAILKAIRQTDLDTEGAMSIVSALRERELVDFGAVKTGPGREKFIPFLRRFWDLERSPYLKDKFAHGHQITRRYCREASQKIERHWKPTFADISLNRITRKELRAYIAALVSLTTGIRSGEVRALRRDNIEEEVLDVSWNWSDTEGLKRPKNGEPRKAPLLPEVKGLLLKLLEESPWKTQENPFIFYSENPDKPCSAMLFLRNLRRVIKETANNPLGWSKEALAGNNPLWVIKGEKNSFGDLEGDWSKPELTASPRSPKGEKTKVRNHYFEYRYLRADIEPDKPKGIEIADRKIDFHSFRHIYAARMADRMAADKVAKVTGHRSKAAAKIYQDHVTARILKEAGNEAAAEFGNILEFTRLEA